MKEITTTHKLPKPKNFETTPTNNAKSMRRCLRRKMTKTPQKEDWFVHDSTTNHKPPQSFDEGNLLALDKLDKAVQRSCKGFDDFISFFSGKMLNTFENSHAFHRRQEERRRAFESIDGIYLYEETKENGNSSNGESARLTLDGFIRDDGYNIHDCTVSQQRHSPRNNNSKRILAGISVFVAILVVFVAVLVPRSFDKDQPIHGTNSDDEPKDGQKNPKYDQLVSLILGWGLTPRAHLDDPDSMSAMALAWLVEDGYITEDTEKLRDRYALACLYFSTQSLEEVIVWKDRRKWLSSEPVCVWHGVSCQNIEMGTKIKALDLSSNGLTRQLPEEIGLLTTLQDLNLGMNSLTSSIPSSITRLTNLHALGLYENYLSSTIPSNISILPRLTVLYLDTNNLTGSIPPLPITLIDLRLGDNLLSGSIEFEFSHLLLLEICYLDNLSLTGTVPRSLGNLKFLHELHLFDNEFSGELPEELSNLSSLKSLYLDTNKFTGTIPAPLGTSMKRLESLYLQSNEFEGTMPRDICELKTTGVLRELMADCGGEYPKVTCSCCSKCL